MKEKVYVLDASGIIGGFISSKNQNVTTNGVISEIKDFKSQITLESALREKNLLSKNRVLIHLIRSKGQ
ncbi:hypothetical protein [Methanobacterium petrolearium]|uniref:hypothetical protein n=1 Tax=Methanobacterium petrolearium TaxID=710190 RepID=UPI0030814536|nr:hypothetical protein GCM10025861_23910 [Methanobacterium petrolearium]